MQKIKAKLNSKRGASMILVLALFLVCVMVSSIILAAASTGVTRNAQRTEQQAGYLAISSASDLLLEELDEIGVYVGKNITGKHGCKDCTVEGYINYEGEQVYGVRLDAEYTSNPLDQDYASNPLDDGHLLMQKEHTPYVYSVKDGDKTTLNGILAGAFERGCNSVFTTNTVYTEKFQIALTPEDERLPEVTCVFSMDEAYNVELLLKTEHNDYAVKMLSTAVVTVSDITESVDTTDVHTIYYKKFDSTTGSYVAVKEEWAIPIEVTTTTTEISWGNPTIEKEVLSQ